MDKHVLNDTERLRKIASTNRQLSSTLSALQSVNRDLCLSVSQMELRLQTQASGRGHLKAELTTAAQQQAAINYNYLLPFRPRWNHRYIPEKYWERQADETVERLHEIPERYQDGPIRHTIPKRVLSCSTR